MARLGSECLRTTRWQHVLGLLVISRSWTAEKEENGLPPSEDLLESQPRVLEHAAAQMRATWRCPWNLKECLGSPGTGVISSQTWALCRSRKCSYLLSHLSSSDLRHLSGSASSVYLKLLVPGSLPDPKDSKEIDASDFCSTQSENTQCGFR
ncbi:hypothetical protein H671_7g17575 [Cricetulus griseus]|nr:hypothetical protein H671_7g17575 [Cricetulus griseus]